MLEVDVQKSNDRYRILVRSSHNNDTGNSDPSSSFTGSSDPSTTSKFVEAGFADWVAVEMNGRRYIELPHTVTHPQFRGQGIARVLVTHILDELFAAGELVIPSCPYVANLIEEDPRYHSLLG